MTTTPKRPYKPRRHNDTNPAKTGRLIRQLRINKEMSQLELALAAGYTHQASICRIEAGTMPIPDGKLIKVARYLGVDPDKIRKPAVKVAK